MKRTLGSLMLCLSFALGCGGSEAGNDIAKACSNAITYCPSGYTWSGYASDENTCQRIFSCVSRMYSGDCRGYITDSIKCLAEISDASGCSACSDIMAQAPQSCPYPTSCL
jgi:hypothetical protein